eukprot:16716-Heterococcus_DN1.PRE.2
MALSAASRGACAVCTSAMLTGHALQRSSLEASLYSVDVVMLSSLCTVAAISRRMKAIVVQRCYCCTCAIEQRHVRLKQRCAQQAVNAVAACLDTALHCNGKGQGKQGIHYIHVYMHQCTFVSPTEIQATQQCNSSNKQ